MSDDPVLLVHNYYQQPGGEDEAFRSEAEMLRNRGHRVATYTVSNARIASMRAVPLATATLFNMATYRELRAVVRRARPRLVHFHNTFPLISPAGYFAARAEGVPVVQTLHNYRLLCLNGLFFRSGRVCEDCSGRTPLAGVRHACYRGDRQASTVVASMLVTHRALRTWSRLVDAHIALNEDARHRFVATGLPAERVFVKPNFVTPDPGPGPHSGQFALFVGRLAEEKGIATLLEAWSGLERSIPLKIVGDGPLRDQVIACSRMVPNVEWLARQPKEEVLRLMRSARCLIIPSLCYENFPIALVEAYATGLPVIASRLGSMAVLVRHEETGLHFRAGDAEDLRSAVRRAWNAPSEVAIWGAAARLAYEQEYTADRNYDQLTGIYRAALARQEPAHVATRGDQAQR